MKRLIDLRVHILTCLALFVGNLLVVGPFLLTGYSDQPWNNSYVYMAISRLFRDHPWTWNPTQYGGAPFHYIYPPVFHVLTALLPVASIGRAFHLVSGAGYALVPVCLYVLAFQLFRSRLAAAFAAVAYSLFPSAAYLLPQWRNLAAPYASGPWGFVALIGYDEAAHPFALPFTLLAIAAAWRDRWTLAGILAALVFLTNWPALLGLAVALTAVGIARARELGLWQTALKAGGTLGIAYGLSAFWMTPGYFVSSSLLNRIVLRHTFSAAPWNGTTWTILASALCLIGVAYWTRAVLLAWVALFGAVLLAYTLAGNYLLPLPHRYMLECNAGLVLLGTSLIARLPRWRVIAFAAVSLAAAPSVSSFLAHAWQVQPHSIDPHTVLSWQLSDWLNQRADRKTGNARVLGSGELDSTLALWSDIPQVGGTGQDVSNFLVFAAERQITYGCGRDSARIARLWLEALNVRYLVVHEAASKEYFHWFAEPGKFATLPLAFDNHAGDRIYQLPDRHEAVVVDLRQLPPLASTADLAFLEAYGSWSAGKRPAEVRWKGNDRADLDVNLGPDEGVLVRINNDRGWSASGATIETDPIGFQLIRPKSRSGSIALRFQTSWEAWLGRLITVAVLLLLLARVPSHWIAAVAVLPALIAYVVLMGAPPLSAGVAEEAFVRLQPPVINPLGIVDAITNRQPPFEEGRIVSIYGLGFGDQGDHVKVWLGQATAEVTYHGPNLVMFRLPKNGLAKVPVSVEVNGCRGNEFEIPLLAQ